MTAMHQPIVTTASTALPPSASTCAPARAAASCFATTIPPLALTAVFLVSHRDVENVMSCCSCHVSSMMRAS